MISVVLNISACQQAKHKVDFMCLLLQFVVALSELQDEKSITKLSKVV